MQALYVHACVSSYLAPCIVLEIPRNLEHWCWISDGQMSTPNTDRCARRRRPLITARRRRRRHRHFRHPRRRQLVSRLKGLRSSPRHPSRHQPDHLPSVQQG